MGCSQNLNFVELPDGLGVHMEALLVSILCCQNACPEPGQIDSSKRSNPQEQHGPLVLQKFAYMDPGSKSICVILPICFVFWPCHETATFESDLKNAHRDFSWFRIGFLVWLFQQHLTATRTYQNVNKPKATPHRLNIGKHWNICGRLWPHTHRSKSVHRFFQKRTRHNLKIFDARICPHLKETIQTRVHPVYLRRFWRSKL